MNPEKKASIIATLTQMAADNMGPEEATQGTLQRTFVTGKSAINLVRASGRARQATIAQEVEQLIGSKRLFLYKGAIWYKDHLGQIEQVITTSHLTSIKEAVQRAFETGQSGLWDYQNQLGHISILFRNEATDSIHVSIPFNPKDFNTVAGCFYLIHLRNQLPADYHQRRFGDSVSPKEVLDIATSHLNQIAIQLTIDPQENITLLSDEYLPHPDIATNPLYI